MRKISGYIISILISIWLFPQTVNAQDTITVPLKIKIGAEVSGPVLYYTNKNILNTEFSLSYDANEKYSPTISAGFLNYNYSQYNYKYTNKGFFIRAGTDVNLMNPKKAAGKYWAGIGLRYGMSLFNSTIPSITSDNYWGIYNSSVSGRTAWGHFIEIAPGVRAELFRNFSIGWTISMRMLLYSGTGKDLRPIYLPGFGNASKNFTSGVSYFFVWNIAYKNKKVIIKPEPPEETDETTNTDNSTRQTFPSRQSGSPIRQ